MLLGLFIGDIGVVDGVAVAVAVFVVVLDGDCGGCEEEGDVVVVELLLVVACKGVDGEVVVELVFVGAVVDEGDGVLESKEPSGEALLAKICCIFSLPFLPATFNGVSMVWCGFWC